MDMSPSRARRRPRGRVPCERLPELFADSVHLNSEGKYLEAVTHYATVFGDDPHDCIVTGLYADSPRTVRQGILRNHPG